MSLTMGSLFDGIGGFPLAASHVGIKTLWASEIEKFPIQVTMKHFPEMVHVGDITKLNGADLPPVDIVCGGSPCQDLSVASGARDGLQGARSGLFYEMIRVIKELRDADRERGRTVQSVRPRWAVWENVPGSFSSGEPPGEDFRIVLRSFTGIGCGAVSIPRPDSGKWKSAGRILLGDTFSLAWRVLNAQYWGVPQRRSRVYLVADFAGPCAPKVLFDEKGLFRDTAQGGDTE
jgi:DNA (cytosine-5)-methyltransferase 1